MVVRFLTYEKLNSNSIDVLELSERASNCMKRANIKTIGDLVANINAFESVRGCGIKVAREVKSALFWYEMDNSKNIKAWLDKVEVHNV